jgi:hypothetical protein
MEQDYCSRLPLAFTTGSLYFKLRVPHGSHACFDKLKNKKIKKKIKKIKK